MAGFLTFSDPAHGEHEATVLDGEHDENWPGWYAASMAEAAGPGS